MSWKCALELDANRRVVAGSPGELVTAIQNAADLRIYTEFLHNEHIDVDSSNAERIREVAEFGVTYRLGDKWVAGIMSLRQPISLPSGFGPRPSMSFFLYNQDGTQAIARPHLDAGTVAATLSQPAMLQAPRGMKKYHVLGCFDEGTNAPSQNFIYDFDVFRYCVSDSWHEVLNHTANGDVVTGSVQDLVDAFSSGCSIKLGISNLCADLSDEGSPQISHEVFVAGGSAYYYTEQRLFMIGTHPVIRVRPAVPLSYGSRNWDFGWLMIRTDGHTVYRRCDPFTLRFSDHIFQLGVRWFVR